MPTYEVYGVVLDSAYEFVSPLPRTTAAAQLRFSCSAAPPQGADWRSVPIVHAEGRRADGESDFVFARFDDHDAVRITGAADFHLWPDRILCHLVDERHRYLVEIALFGMVLALWLELRGVPTLHASAVVVRDSAVGFLATKGGGKTSTAAACLAGGHDLLTDDLLAVDELGGGFFGHPGCQMLRLWPEQAERFVGPAWEKLPIVHPEFAKRRVAVGSSGFGTARDRPARLERLYLPERSGDPATPVTITPLRPQQALMALLRHSFLPREVQRYGLQPARMAKLARLTAAVPVARLRYPSGFDRLAAVVEAIGEDAGRS